MGVSVEIDDQVSPELRVVAERVSPQRIAAEVGPRFTRLMQRHFLANGKNKRGWPSTHFWGRAAKATNWQAADGGAVDIVCNQVGVRQRYYGGTIKPVHKEALTIPLSGKAYGKVASDFPGLFLMVTKAGAFLARYTSAPVKATEKRKRGVKKQSSTIEVLFKLARSVTQDPDKSVVPDDDTFNRELDKSIAVLLARPVAQEQ